MLELISSAFGGGAFGILMRIGNGFFENYKAAQEHKRKLEEAKVMSEIAANKSAWDAFTASQNASVPPANVSPWAANVITAFITIDGESVGVVANQPMILAGTLDIPASQKAARFVSFCDAFNIPLLTLVDTPGFYPGKDLEWRGMIRHGGQLVFAYARATVPRVCVILRKSYGGAYIVMDSKKMGNDLCLAWPTAELAVMGAGQAAAILQRRATPEERAAFEADYSERLLNPYVAAERGYVDAVINPEETRREVAAALVMLRDKRERLAPRKHDNTPL
jgi:acetyl-CoA carboxylase carboxyltransferase component